MTPTLPSSREVASHEAHHVAGLLLAGLLPKEVRVDRPDETTAGCTEIDWGEDGVDPAKARHVLVAVVLGGMCNGFQGWNSWPLNPDNAPDGSRRDAEQAAILASYLKLDQAGWLHTVWQANRLARRPAFRRLVVAIAAELEDREVLDQHDLVTIHKEATCSTSP